MTKQRIRHIADLAAKTKDDTAGAMLTECLAEIAYFQSFTRRGIDPQELPHKANEELPLAAKVKTKGAPDPRIAEFIDGWHNAFLECFKEKYKVQGVKDAVAVKRLIATGSTVDQLLDLAWEAWKHADKFNCKQAATILGFEQRFNDIRIELKTLANGGRVRTEPAGVNL